MATEEKDFIINNMNTFWSKECTESIETVRTMFDNLKKYESLCLVTLQDLNDNSIYIQPMRSGNLLKLIRTRHNCDYSMYEKESIVIYRFLTASDIDMINDVLIYDNNKYRICRIQTYTKKDWSTILNIK